jgi:hypothetical protein
VMVWRRRSLTRTPHALHSPALPFSSGCSARRCVRNAFSLSNALLQTAQVTSSGCCAATWASNCATRCPQCRHSLQTPPPIVGVSATGSRNARPMHCYFDLNLFQKREIFLFTDMWELLTILFCNG